MPSPIAPYAPVNVPKPVASDVWIVDGPVMRAGPGGKLPVTIRMTVVRLPDGGLWLHSPVPFDAALHAALAALGPVRHLVAPNLALNSFIGGWQRACPDAALHAVPGTAARLARRNRPLRVDAVLGEAPDPRWGGAFAVLLARGLYMDEAVFFHHASRTLILTDLVANFEPARIRAWPLRAFALLSGTLAPHGGAPRYYRWTFVGRSRAALRDAVRTMLGFAPERVIFAHGAWFADDAVARLRAAFRWLRV